MLPICIEAFTYTSNIEFDYNEISDELALAQLREQLLIAYNMNIASNEIDFIYKNKYCKLSLVNRKLLLQPGTQIYLNDIDNLYFDIKGDVMFVNYEKDNKQFERAICKQEGLYIDNFSDCNVFDDVVDSDEE